MNSIFHHGAFRSRFEVNSEVICFGHHQCKVWMVYPPCIAWPSLPKRLNFTYSSHIYLISINYCAHSQLYPLYPCMLYRHSSTLSISFLYLKLDTRAKNTRKYKLDIEYPLSSPGWIYTSLFSSTVRKMRCGLEQEFVQDTISDRKPG